MGAVASLLATAVVLASPPSIPRERGLVLLSDNRVVQLALPSGRIIGTRRLAAPPRARAEPSRMLARSDSRLFVLVRSGENETVAVLDLRTLRVSASWQLEPDVDYRGIVFADDRLYAYGGRLGDEVDATNHLREQSAVVTQLDGANGINTGTTTIMPAGGRRWWIYWAAARADGRQLTLSYHGGCIPPLTRLCTSGGDWVEVEGMTLKRCEQPSGLTLGCLEEAHGMVEPFGVGWIAASGGESLLQYGRSGNVLRRLHTGLRRDHVMNFGFAPGRSSIYVISSCLYGRDGLRRISLASGSSKLVRAKICGERVLAGRTALVVQDSSRLDVRRLQDARLIRRRTFSAGVLDVLVTH